MAEAPERPAELDPMVPFPPMEAELVRELPAGDGWVVRAEMGRLPRRARELRRRDTALVAERKAACCATSPSSSHSAESLPPRSALDGEIVIEHDGAIDFDAMQTRLHPAESRIRKLVGRDPGSIRRLRRAPLEGRRDLAAAVRGTSRRRSSGTPRHSRSHPRPPTPRPLSPGSTCSSRSASTASSRSSSTAPVEPGQRGAVVKVKPERTADCVVVGLRWKSKPDRIATLLLGLRRDDGGLDYVGSAAVAASRHAQIAEAVLPLLERAPERSFSEPNRWGGGALEEQAVRPELVAEVRYDKVQGNRFRHGTKLLRFRPDKDPAACTWDELRPPRDPSGPTIGDLLSQRSADPSR